MIEAQGVIVGLVAGALFVGALAALGIGMAKLIGADNDDE